MNIYLCAKSVDSDEWLQLETKIDTLTNKDIPSEWQIRFQGGNDQMSNFYLVGKKGIFQYSVCTRKVHRDLVSVFKKIKKKSKKLKFSNFIDPVQNDEIVIIEKESLNKTISYRIACFSKRQDLFLVPAFTRVEIYTPSFDKMIYSIDFDHETILLLLDDENDIMLVYDSHCYYEINLIDFKVMFRKRFKHDRLGMQFPLNLEHFPSNAMVKLNKFNENVIEVSFVDKQEHFNLFKFPMNSLLRSMSSLQNRKDVLEFARYYYDRLAKFEGKNHLYGALNPLLFAICAKNSDLLREILNDYGYPRCVVDFASPLSYEANQKRLLKMQIICEYLVSHNCLVDYSRNDFNCLLESPQKQCHSLIASIPARLAGQGLPLHLCMDQDREIYHTDNALSFVHRLRNRETLKSKKRSSMEEVDFYELGFDYSFESGTKDSLYFLYKYSNSQSKEFVLSIWEQLVQWKWMKLSWWLLPYIFFYLFFAVSSTYFILFENIGAYVRGCFLANLALLLVYELFQGITLTCLKLGGYWKDKYNILDMFILILSIVYYVIQMRYSEQESWKVHFDKLVGSLLMILMYFRLFTFFWMITIFGILVGMITTIMMELIPYLIILIYFVVAGILVTRKIEEENTFFKSVEEMYIFGLFGGLDGESFGSDTYKFIPVIFVTMLIAVVLMNIMIAYLSNLFSKLEEDQSIIELRHKASLIMEVEIMHFLLKCFRSKEKKNENQSKNKKVKKNENRKEI